MYIVTGAAGNVEKHDRPVNHITTSWNKVTDYTHYGISMLSASRSSLTWEFVTSADQRVIDSFTVIKVL